MCFAVEHPFLNERDFLNLKGRVGTVQPNEIRSASRSSKCSRNSAKFGVYRRPNRSFTA